MARPRTAALAATIGILVSACAPRVATPARTALPREALVVAREEKAATEPAPPASIPLHLPCADDDVAGCTTGCNDKHPEDCVTLAAMLLSGTHIAKDADRGVAMFRAACDGGSARGCLKLADAYHAGVVRDDVGEAGYYFRACEAGANLGCVAAGKAYLTGRGVGADSVLAAALFKKVCERGNAPACFELGRLYKAGEGVPVSVAKAEELFRKACELGLDEGCFVGKGTGEATSPRE